MRQGMGQAIAGTGHAWSTGIFNTAASGPAAQDRQLQSKLRPAVPGSQEGISASCDCNPRSFHCQDGRASFLSAKRNVQVVAQRPKIHLQGARGRMKSGRTSRTGCKHTQTTGKIV